MITPRITCCKECVDIIPLIEEIDCKLSKLSNGAYNSIVYASNNSVDQTEPIVLLFYKRILEYKIVNPNYVGAFSVEMIASRIKKYTVGCKPSCSCLEFMEYLGFIPTTTTTSSTTTTSTSTTTTTTTIPPTTTTSTTIISYSYTTATYNCYCKFLNYDPILNATPLSPSKFYYNSNNNTTFKVVASTGTPAVAPTSSFLDSTKKNSCPTVTECSTTSSTSTTTTTTTCRGFIYNVSLYKCDCSPDGGGTLTNDVSLIEGQWYYRLGLNQKIHINSFSQCDTNAVHHVDVSSQSDSCGGVACPTTTTTTTPTPTTTTTTTPTPIPPDNHLLTIGRGEFASLAGLCAENFVIPVWCASTILGVGTQVFQFGMPFPGGRKWYSYNLGATGVVLIKNDGFVEAIGPCV